MTDGLQVQGGRAGTAARLEDLRAAAQALRSATQALRDAADCLRQAYLATWSASDAAAGVAARLELEAVRAGPDAPQMAADRLATLTRQVELTADGYAGADGFVAGLLRAGSAATGYAWGDAMPWNPTPWLRAGRGVLPAMLLTAWQRDRAPQTGDIARSGAAEPLMQGVAGWLVGAAPGHQAVGADPVGQVSAGLALALRMLQPAHQLRVVTSPRRPAPAPRGDGDAMRAVTAAAAAGAGTVSVARLDHPDGTTSWVVAIPGTQEMSPATGNPLDMESNVAVLGLGASDATALVARAMQAAGVGEDEPVMLVGHSQGGMTAMALASAPTLPYRVTHVLTAGSPVATASPRSGVRVLSVEHSSDAVPALDGRPNPDTPDWITVRRELADSADPRDRAAGTSLGSSHGSDVYLRTVQAVDRAEHASLQAWRDSVGADIYGPPGTTATVIDVTGTVEPAEPARGGNRAEPTDDPGPVATPAAPTPAVHAAS